MVILFDTTLRDGEQMPGVVFGKENKLTLAEKIFGLGIDYLELMPAISKEEREISEVLVEKYPDKKIFAATMMRKNHINLAYDCGIRNIVLFTSISDIHLDKKLKISREENLSRSREYVDYAKEKGFTVLFAGEDATRADFSYLMKFVNSLCGKVDYFIPCDTLGVLTPYQTYDWIKKIKENCSSKIGLHIHNDFGCATANTLAGIRAGADLVSGTFTGIGERSGNVALEEVIFSLENQYNFNLGLDCKKLGELCSLVEEYSGVDLQKHKPVVGENAFSHESGIHVDGILKDPINYEIVDPSSIGRKRKIVFGKHSGVAGLKYLFGDKFNGDDYQNMLLKIKSLSQKQRRAFSSSEVMRLFL